MVLNGRRVRGLAMRVLRRVVRARNDIMCLVLALGLNCCRFDVNFS